MSAQAHPSHEPESRRHTLVNWLGLVALLAVGIFAAPAHTSVPAPRAGALMHTASAGDEAPAAMRVAVRVRTASDGQQCPRIGQTCGCRRCQKALRPVSVRPIVSWWIVSVPS
jgi:hypothetical protein